MRTCDRQNSDLTLKVGLVSWVGAVADCHAGRMNHELPAAAQPGLDLPGSPSLLQAQDEQVVLATEADQDPLPHINPLAEEPQGAGPVAEVGTDRQVTFLQLRAR